jgi:hypothetical protein
VGVVAQETAGVVEWEEEEEEAPGAEAAVGMQSKFSASNRRG